MAIPQSYGTLSVLCASVVHEFSAGEPCREVAKGRCGGRPQPERAIDVHPCTMPVRDFDRGFERIERARVDVARLQAHDHRRSRVECLERLGQRVDSDSTLVVDGNGLRTAEAEISQREVDGFVPLSADEHVDPRRSSHSVVADIPANPGEHRATCGCQAREVRHHRSGHEAHISSRGESEKFEHPGSCGFLCRHHRRRRKAHPGVLVPRAHQPIRTERGGERSADHPTEEAARLHCHEPGFGQGGEQIDDVLRW